MTTPTEVQTYETCYTRMQEIVARLEAGELPLAEAMALYEEGTRLAATCQQLLDAAELRIQELRIGGAASSEE
ncbi:exodeoxyribonuclease VII small subunit [Chloroflexia bacterium SDU3-3]|nr:exodeoxyribonuclease VII small subunit [Chloroflexia bacterium SDU3-3]